MRKKSNQKKKNKLTIQKKTKNLFDKKKFLKTLIWCLATSFLFSQNVFSFVDKNEAYKTRNETKLGEKKSTWRQHCWNLLIRRLKEQNA
jgi:hypothetical protein